MNKVGEQIAVVIVAIIGVAALAVFLSRNSNTANVITAAGSGLAQALGAALSPITGNNYSGAF